MTTLTDEQRELIRQNRERALAIQREKKRQREGDQESNELIVATAGSPEKRLRDDDDDDDDDDKNVPSVAGAVERSDDAPPVLPSISTIIDPTGSMSARKSAAAPAGGATTDGLASTTNNNNDGDNDDDEEPLEDFEVGASEFVTRQDAMKLYCLPTGTLDVCQYVERPNPRHASWKPMRLYHRKEIRQRARRRFGGRAGLVRERQQRADKRLSNDLAKASQLFR